MDLYQEFHDVMQSSTEEEKEVLRLALQAIRQKRERGSAYPSGFLGLSGEFVEDGVYRFRVPITPYMMNRGGIVHGGVIGTLADSTMGSLINKSLPEGKVAVTVEMKVNYLEPGVGSELISEARLIRLGNTLTFADCKVENGSGKRIAHATGTFAIIPMTS